jgi:hypothetical protein
MVKGLAAAITIAAGLMAHSAYAEVLRVDFNTPKASQTLGKTLTAADSVLARGAATDNGNLRNTIEFKSNAPEISVSLSWLIGADFRAVGLNVDLLAPNGTVLASDIFLGFTDDIAISRLDFNGLDRDKTYRLVITGDIVTTGVYTLGVDVSN